LPNKAPQAGTNRPSWPVGASGQLQRTWEELRWHNAGAVGGGRAAGVADLPSLLIALGIIPYMPALTLWLPNAVFG
jgi:hypothetical protein